MFSLLSFLTNRSDPKKRFKFFLKATQIDTVIEKLNDCSSHYASAKKQLEYQKNVVVSLKDELDKVQTKFNSLQSIGFLKVWFFAIDFFKLSKIKIFLKFQETLSTLKIELAWLKVENEENLLKDITDTLSKYQNVYDELMESMNNRQQNEGNRAARCELLTEQMNELKKEMNADEAQKEQMRKNISKDEEARNEVNRNLQKINKKSENFLKNIGQLEKDMSESSES